MLRQKLYHLVALYIDYQDFNSTIKVHHFSIKNFSNKKLPLEPLMENFKLVFVERYQLEYRDIIVQDIF